MGWGGDGGLILLNIGTRYKASVIQTARYCHKDGELGNGTT